jgi:hypothetical protein
MSVPDALVDRLIEEISPLNNLYREAVREGRQPFESIGYMWDIGEVLRSAGVEEPYPVAERIQRESYITRDLLTFSWRVRGYFTDRRSIKRRFGQISYLTAFRWAFPLLEGGRYRLSKAGERELVRLVNSDANLAEIKREVSRMKQGRLPATSSRESSPGGAGSFAAIYAQRLADLEMLMRQGSRQKLLRFLEPFTPEALLSWNKLCLAFADDSFAPPQSLPPLDGIPWEWADLIESMYVLASRGREARNRARRLVDRMDFVTMGNCVGILRDREKLEKHLERTS